ncbi:response regulator [Microvirga sp. 3-52]|uniref:adenylate/guanylate cyclase domain-containing protein n=1 Tax=Microvirga sp. 3-52 TaxID=2792425 RepID=UPI001AC00DBB|nr:adenylate/guanylate cyclase domain-containing response regulator [Microvirga sp. 3-52]MBO1909450.1 response regulator [Microvirga sp. 3-52]MBS7454511.1 response regulator [Microvirga sp. 3-52]
MRDVPLILAVDDTPQNLDLLTRRLQSQGYEVATAADGVAALARVADLVPDLILLDIMMPKLDGIETVRRLKADAAYRHIPVILVTAKSDPRDVVEGLDAGGDDYLTKPIDHAALLARVRSMLRIKTLHDIVLDQARELAEWNQMLEQRVAEQVEQIGRMGRLRRFLPPQVADLVVAGCGGLDPLESHRRDVTVVFGDLRGFTSFAETAKPEEVITVLREYHAAVGDLVMRYEGTLERFVGDGVLVLFNDPLLQRDHTERAVMMSLKMRECIQFLAEGWRKRGHDLGFGVSVARGHATLGSVGFEHRLEYSVIGTIPNLACRLCSEARSGQILLTRRVVACLRDTIEAVLIGKLDLKGFHKPVPAFELVSSRSASDETTCTAIDGKAE